GFTQKFRDFPGSGACALYCEELRRSSTDPEMIRLRPNLVTPSLRQELRRRRRCEETAARTVRTPAAPELAVGRRLSFAEWHHLVELRPNAGERALDDHVALAGHHHGSFGTMKQSPAPQHHSPAALRLPRLIQESWARESPRTHAVSTIAATKIRIGDVFLGCPSW